MNYTPNQMAKLHQIAQMTGMWVRNQGWRIPVVLSIQNEALEVGKAIPGCPLQTLITFSFKVLLDEPNEYTSVQKIATQIQRLYHQLKTLSAYGGKSEQDDNNGT